MTARRLRLSMLAAGGVALAVCAAAWAYDPRLFMGGWLVAALFWLALSLGALPVLMTYHLTGGRWGAETEPALRAALAALPVALGTFLVPLGFGLSTLFPWTRPLATLPEVVVRKTAWLNSPFFSARTLICFALWLVLAWFMDAWRRDATRHRALSAGGPILWVFTTTVFSFDWLMSLEPEWYSDIFGLYVGAGVVLAAMAFALLATAIDDEARDERRIAGLQDFANLLLAVAIGWLFIDFSQYLIIWMGNLPHEIGWYLHRRASLWQALAVVAFSAFFVVPLSVFLFRRCKRSRVATAAAATTILLGHLAQCAWLVLPSVPPGGWIGLGMTTVAWLAIGGCWLFIFLLRFAVLPRSEAAAPPKAELVHD